MARRKNRAFETNRYSRIVSKQNGGRTIVTETKDRDEGTLIVEARSKRAGAGATRVFVRDSEGNYVALNGSEARTLFRTLRRHFDVTGRSSW